MVTGKLKELITRHVLPDIIKCSTVVPRFSKSLNPGENILDNHVQYKQESIIQDGSYTYNSDFFTKLIKQLIKQINKAIET